MEGLRGGEKRKNDQGGKEGNGRREGRKGSKKSGKFRRNDTGR